MGSRVCAEGCAGAWESIPLSLFCLQPSHQHWSNPARGQRDLSVTLTECQPFGAQDRAEKGGGWSQRSSTRGTISVLIGFGGRKQSGESGVILGPQGPKVQRSQKL